MPDLSALDQKYFIDRYKYNCPFCNRRHVSYHITLRRIFDWDEKRKCHVYFVYCESCNGISMHLSYEEIASKSQFDAYMMFEPDMDIDSKIFYSVPTSYFVIDENIPKVLRELIVEAEGCLKMNFLTGATGCTRKAIYEFLLKEKAAGISYADKIKDVKGKFLDVDSTYFDILGDLQEMTSDNLHEDSWDEWDSEHLKLIIGTLKNIFKDMYVIPEEKKNRRLKILDLKQKIYPSKSKENK